jgi:hypothetical protein
MRTLTVCLSLVAIVAVARARADPPRLRVTMAENKKAPSPTCRGACPVTLDLPVVVSPRKDAAALTRMQLLAARALQPRVAVPVPLVHTVKLTPTWPLGANITLEYGWQR